MIFKGEQYILAFLIIFIRITSQDQKSFYTAAVVEYGNKERNNKGAIDIAEYNAFYYCKNIELAADYKVDIIVFPELGLTSKSGNRAELLAAATAVPNPDNTVVPCNSTDNYQNYFRKLSCAAAEKKMYVVINVHEKAGCLEPSTCDPKLYSTNVVFDRSGTVVARHRKYTFSYSGSEDAEINRPIQELSIFTTDFNVTFAQFIGNDIMMERDVQVIIKKKNIFDIVYSTRWLSDKPFLPSSQYLLGITSARNFLGSGFSDPDLVLNETNGIFAGPKVLKQNFSPFSHGQIEVANVSKIFKNGTRDPSLKFKHSRNYRFPSFDMSTLKYNKFWVQLSRDDLTAYTTKSYDYYGNEMSTTLCNNGLCCEFNIKSKRDVSILFRNQEQYLFRYRLVVFKGVRKSTVAPTGIELCGVIACLNNTLASCGQNPDPKLELTKSTIFTSIHITGSIEKGFRDSESYHPFLISSYEHYPEHDFTSSIDETRNQISLTLEKPMHDLMAFAIQRDLNKDNTETTTSSNNEATSLNNEATTSSNNEATKNPNDAATHFVTHEIFITILSSLFVRMILL